MTGDDWNRIRGIVRNIPPNLEYVCNYDGSVDLCIGNEIIVKIYRQKSLNKTVDIAEGVCLMRKHFGGLLREKLNKKCEGGCKCGK